MSRSFLGKLTLVVAATCLCSPPATAITLLLQTELGISAGNTSINPLPVTADDFAPTADWLAEGAEIIAMWNTAYGSLDVSAARQLRAGFYADNSGQPAHAPFADFSVDAALSPLRSDGLYAVYAVSFDFPTKIFLADSVPVWFFVQDDDRVTGGAIGMYWALSFDGNTRLAQKSNPSDRWQIFDGHDQAMRLHGIVVPEPSAVTMCATAALIASFAGRRLGRPWVAPCRGLNLGQRSVAISPES